MDARLPKGEGLTGSFFATLTTLVAVAALARNFLPPDWIRAIRRLGNKITNYLDPFCYFTFQEFTGQSPDQNYDKVKLYLSGKGIAAARRVLVSQPKNSAQPVFALADNEALTDKYMGIAMLWTHYISQRTAPIISENQSASEDIHSFRLRVHNKHKQVVEQYLKYVRQEADIIEKKGRELLVYTNTGSDGGFRKMKRMWDSQPFKHPATFNTLALDTKLKQAVMQKLDSFSKDAAFYSQTGRAHKMGFFLFGPPGTGKTTFIAAVANYMQYSVYDLDLTGVSSNLDLRALLTQITDRAVVVIEDIDTVELPNRANTPQESGGPPERGMGGRRGVRDEDTRSKLTLGGVLNFADGIRSSCGSERIFIFTTNHPERLDPALIRPGRMDMHIELSYCTFEVFTSLCRTYLGVSDHPKFAEIQPLLTPSTKVAPADVTAVLDADRLHPDKALQHMLEHLQTRGGHKQE